MDGYILRLLTVLRAGLTGTKFMRFKCFCDTHTHLIVSSGLRARQTVKKK